jgi:hypothetical protein
MSKYKDTNNNLENGSSQKPNHASVDTPVSDDPLAKKSKQAPGAGNHPKPHKPRRKPSSVQHNQQGK